MKRLALCLVFATTAAPAQQITADRPGVGVDPETVPQGTLQPEMGSDGEEVRIGISKGFEVDWQGGGGDHAEGVKLSLVDNAFAKASLRLAYDSQLHTVIEVPTNITITHWFNLGLDAAWSKSTKIYAAEFNFQPTQRLTITPTAYYQDKPRAAIFAAWVPPGHDNAQFDAGYDQHRLSIGISTALDFSHLFRRN